jgi:hypothetical protein
MIKKAILLLILTSALLPHSNGQTKSNLVSTKNEKTQFIPPSAIKEESKQTLPGKIGLRDNDEKKSTNNADWGQEIKRKTVLANELEKRRLTDPNNGIGMINIDFGIAKQGEEIVAYFPANFVTLEKEETLMTPSVDLIRYARFTECKGVINVIPARNSKLNRIGHYGFEVFYNTTSAIGKVDEIIEVFTEKGNLYLRLTGFVVGKNTVITSK